VIAIDGPAAGEESEEVGTPGDRVRSIRLLLLEGYQDDEVVVSIDDREVERRSAVTTSLLLGLADEVTFEVPADAREIQVTVPTKGGPARAQLPEGDATFLANVDGGELVLVLGTGREGAM
jgi:hypothetical protein